jgi:integrase
MVVDLLDAASAWEKDVPPHQRYGRRAVLALLCLAGPRISELTLADRSELDLASSRYWIPESKADAGERTVDLTAYLASELRAHAAAKALVADGPMFPRRTGGRLNPSNVRNRLLTETVRRANERKQRGALPLPKQVTPHTLRRTYTSLCFFAGRDPRYVIADRPCRRPPHARRVRAVHGAPARRLRPRVDVDALRRRARDPGVGPTNGPTPFDAPPAPTKLVHS